MVAPNWEKRLSEAVNTCEAITHNLKAKGYQVEVMIILTDKKTGKKTEIKI